MSEELRIPPGSGPIRVTWRVEDGQEVETGQVICELETDRAMVELEAPARCVVETLVASWTELKPGALFGRVHRT